MYRGKKYESIESHGGKLSAAFEALGGTQLSSVSGQGRKVPNVARPPRLGCVRARFNATRHACTLTHCTEAAFAESRRGEQTRLWIHANVALTHTRTCFFVCLFFYRKFCTAGMRQTRYRQKNALESHRHIWLNV